MRRLAAFSAALVMAFLLAFSAAAERVTAALTPDNVNKWQGTPLECITNDANYFRLTDPAGLSYAEYDASQANSVYISFDAGNYAGKGQTSFRAAFIGADGILYERTFSIPDNGFFRRYEFGEKNMFAGLPEGTVKVRVEITGGSGYFRDLSVTLSNTDARNMNADEMYKAGTSDLDPVEVNVTRGDYWTMVLFVCGVAAVMMFSVKMRDNIKKRK